MIIKFNRALIKFSMGQLIKQPLVRFYYLVFFVVCLISFFLNFTFSNQRLINISLFSYSVDEPFFIQSALNASTGLFFWINNFVIILITNKFWGDVVKNPILNIFIAKLRSKSLIISSYLISAFFVFILPFFLVTTLFQLIFIIKYSFAFVESILLINLVYACSIIYVLSFSFLLSQFFDEFFTSLILIILLFIGSYVNSDSNIQNISVNIFNLVSPLSFFENTLTTNICHGFLFEISPFVSLIVSSFYYYLGIKIFLSGNN